eukprot:5499180-Pleurochrysis_carterae.AAC.4
MYHMYSVSPRRWILRRAGVSKSLVFPVLGSGPFPSSVRSITSPVFKRVLASKKLAGPFTRDTHTVPHHQARICPAVFVAEWVLNARHESKVAADLLVGKEEVVHCKGAVQALRLHDKVRTSLDDLPVVCSADVDGALRFKLAHVRGVDRLGAHVNLDGRLGVEKVHCASTKSDSLKDCVLVPVDAAAGVDLHIACGLARIRRAKSVAAVKAGISGADMKTGEHLRPQESKAGKGRVRVPWACINWAGVQKW